MYYYNSVCVYVIIIVFVIFMENLSSANFQNSIHLNQWLPFTSRH